MPTLLQAEEKRARNPVPKCPSKLLEPAIGRSAGWSSLQGNFGTELRARFFCSFEYCPLCMHCRMRGRSWRPTTAIWMLHTIKSRFWSSIRIYHCLIQFSSRQYNKFSKKLFSNLSAPKMFVYCFWLDRPTRTKYFPCYCSRLHSIGGHS